MLVKGEVGPVEGSGYESGCEANREDVLVVEWDVCTEEQVGFGGLEWCLSGFVVEEECAEAEVGGRFGECGFVFGWVDDDVCPGGECVVGDGYGFPLLSEVGADPPGSLEGAGECGVGP